MPDTDDLEIYYIYHGNDGEEVPESVETLIVNNGVRRLPEDLCCNFMHLREVSLPNGLISIEASAFGRCYNLLEIKICTTIKFIGETAFWKCKRLATVEFEFSSSPHQLRKIDDEAFHLCSSLQRITPPSSVTVIGQSAFEGCVALVEADLSKTCIRQISPWAFGNCTSLQAVSLPNTLESICLRAFYNCSELVTVEIPPDSPWIEIEYRSFDGCRQLSNLLLPKYSRAKEDSFIECLQLEIRFGSNILEGLMGRFDAPPVHRMCYKHSEINTQELRQCIEEQDEDDSLVDEFGMTPFHILCSTVEPDLGLVELLLDQYSYQFLSWKDLNGKRPFDYLMNNWTDATATWLQRTMQKWMVDPLVHWGTMTCVEEMKTKVRCVLSGQDKEQRITLFNEAYSAFVHHEMMERTSILELALWKRKLKSGWSNDGSKRKALDRGESRCLCGADVVIPNVTLFLLAQGHSSTFVDV